MAFMKTQLTQICKGRESWTQVARIMLHNSAATRAQQTEFQK